MSLRQRGRLDQAIAVLNKSTPTGRWEYTVAAGNSTVPAIAAIPIELDGRRSAWRAVGGGQPASSPSWEGMPSGPQPSRRSHGHPLPGADRGCKGMVLPSHPGGSPFPSDKTWIFGLDFPQSTRFAPGSVPGFFDRRLAVSTITDNQPTSPATPCGFSTTRCGCSHTPAFVHACYRWYAVGQATPNSSGRCRHEQLEVNA